MVLGKVSLVVRSSLDVYDRISAKSSDPSLEPLLQSIPDPFDTYGPQKSEDQIYSILPLGILSARSSSSSPTPGMLSASATVTDSDSGVKSWMDQTTSAADASAGGGEAYAYPYDHPITPSPTATPDWGNMNVDWADQESRARRHSLPTLATPTTLIPSINLPSSSSGGSLSASSNSLRVPFPVGMPPSPPERRRTGESKLRQVLSAIGESGSGSSNHSIDGEDHDRDDGRSSPNLPIAQAAVYKSLQDEVFLVPSTPQAKGGHTPGSEQGSEDEDDSDSDESADDMTPRRHSPVPQVDEISSSSPDLLN